MRITQELIVSRLHGARPHGRYFSAFCPFHDDVHERSLLVYPDGAYCMMETRSYSLVALWKKVGGLLEQPIDDSRSNLIDWQAVLEDKDEFIDNSHSVLMRFTNLRLELERRGIEGRIIPNRIGWHKGFFVFPLFDYAGELSGIILRATPSVQKKTKTRYLISPGQELQLYCPDWGAVERSRYVFRVYGIFDALTLAALGYPVVTSSEGKKFRSEWFDPPIFRKKIIDLPDKGEEISARLNVSELGWRGRLGLLDYPEGCKDVNDFVQRGYTTLLHKELRRVKNVK